MRNLNMHTNLLIAFYLASALFLLLITQNYYGIRVPAYFKPEYEYLKQKLSTEPISIEWIVISPLVIGILTFFWLLIINKPSFSRFLPVIVFILFVLCFNDWKMKASWQHYGFWSVILGIIAAVMIALSNKFMSIQLNQVSVGEWSKIDQHQNLINIIWPVVFAVIGASIPLQCYVLAKKYETIGRILVLAQVSFLWAWIGIGAVFSISILVRILRYLEVLGQLK